MLWEVGVAENGGKDSKRLEVPTGTLINGIN